MAAEARVPEPRTPEGAGAPLESLRHAQARVLHYRNVLLRAGQEIERRLSRLDLLAAAVGQASEPTAVLHEALGAAMGMLDADTGAILIIEDELHPPTLGAQQSLDGAFEAVLTGKQFEWAALLLPKILEGNLLVYGTSDERGTPPELRQLLVSLHFGWLLSLPLRSGGKLLGALVIAAKRPAVITVQDSHWLALVGQQAALALETVRLRKHMWSLAEAIFGQEHETVEPSARPSPEPPEDLEALLEAMMAAEEEVQHFNQDLTMLNRLGEALGQSLKPETVLHTVVDQCGRILGVGKVWVYLLDEDQPYLTLRMHNGLSSRYLQARGRLPLKEGMESQVLAGGEVVLLPDLLESAAAGKLVLEAEGLRGTFMAPLRARDLGIGVLGGAHDVPHQWTSREGRLVRAIAAQASLALHNAALYDQVRDAAQAQQMSNKVLQDLNMHLLESQAAQQAQFEQSQQSAALVQTLSRDRDQVREQVAVLMRRVRALCGPDAGPLTPSQQAHADTLVREIAALAHLLDPGAS